MVATRRLRFHSGAQSVSTNQDTAHTGQIVLGAAGSSPDLSTDLFSSPAKPDYEQDTAGTVVTCRTVQQMELCTPQVVRCTGPQYSHCTQSARREVRLGSLECTATVAMDMCTPQVARDFSSPSVGRRTSVEEETYLCTPAVNLRNKFTEGMDLCTPAVTVGRGRDIMAMCTPAVGVRNRITDAMDLCTPAVGVRMVSDSMDLCTPAFTFKTDRTGTSDCMELCTPAMGRLELKSEFEVLTATTDLTISKPEMKDSGISSPETSRRDLEEELFWFVTPTPVRGFK